MDFSLSVPDAHATKPAAGSPARSFSRATR
jgi:hypothetical protein